MVHKSQTDCKLTERNENLTTFVFANSAICVIILVILCMQHTIRNSL